jgi:crotonobetaine/carnitine-CoA ligase
MAYIDDITLRQLLEARAREDGDRAFCFFEDETITFSALENRVNRLANGFIKLGLRAGDRVAVMLPNHPDHIYTLYALAKLGAVFVPVNVNLKGDSLDLLLNLSDPRAVVADRRYSDSLREALAQRRSVEFLVWRGEGASDIPVRGSTTIDELSTNSSSAPPAVRGPGPDDVLLLGYTSGTTGVPKGAPLTDRMWRACAFGCGLASDVRPGEVMLLWEPIYHIGGSQGLHLCLIRRAIVAMLERFSASQFWDQARRYGATQIHYLGGILQMLLAQPPRPDDRDHKVRIAWGGGCTTEAWRPFEERFGVTIHEDYGMTECSSITTVNTDCKLGSIGKPVDFFEVMVADENGLPVPVNQFGEILVRSKQPGLIIKEYFRNPEATRAAIRSDGWFRTGDLGSIDEEGFLYFHGRTKDCVRRGGENISAWEVERVINKHPDIEESALIGVKTEIGLDDLKIFVKTAPGHPHPAPPDLIEWCEGRMPKFQVPRYVAFIDSFDKTPSQRIKKECLSRSTTDCWDHKASATSEDKQGS